MLIIVLFLVASCIAGALGFYLGRLSKEPPELLLDMRDMQIRCLQDSLVEAAKVEYALKQELYQERARTEWQINALYNSKGRMQ